MRNLVCVEHDNWDNTLAMIRQKGGKAGNGVFPPSLLSILI